MLNSPKARSIAAVVLLFILTVLFYAPIIFSDRTFVARDNYSFYNPQRFFAAETVSNGSLPLWNPYVGCGMPFQATLQSAVFYPFSAIYYLLPFQKGFKYFIVLHYFLGALNMFLLMRGWRNDRKTAFFSAMVFAFCGYLASINNNVAFITAGIWLPLVMLFHHYALKANRLFFSLLAGSVISLQIFAGDMSFYLLASLVCTFFYTLFWSFSASASHPPSRFKPWGFLGVSWLSAMILAAVQLIPFCELVFNSKRFGGLTFAEITQNSLHPLEITQLIIPYIFGTALPMTRWFGQFWLDTTYMGLFPLFFILLFVFFKSNWLKPFLISIAVVSIVLSFGKYNPLYFYLYHYLPGISMLKFPVKFFFIASFAFSVMAGKGLSCFLHLVDQKKTSLRLLQGTGCLVMLAATVFAVLSVWKQEFFQYWSRYVSVFEPDISDYVLDTLFYSLNKSIAFSVFLGGVLLLLIFLAARRKISKNVLFVLIVLISFADLTQIPRSNTISVDETVFSQENPTTAFLKKDPSVFRIYPLVWLETKDSFLHLPGIAFEPVYRFMKQALHKNTVMYHNIPSADQYSAILNMRYQNVFHPVVTYFKMGLESNVPISYCQKILNLLNIKYIVSPTEVKGFNFQLVSDNGVKVYENLEVLPRAFLVEKLKVVKNEDAVLHGLQRSDFSPSREAYISERESQKIGSFFLKDSQSAGGAKIKQSAVFIRQYDANFIELELHVKRSGILVLADNYYPGWKAFSDEGELPVLRVNYTLRGIPVKGGKQELTLRYRPVSFTIGAWISILGFVLLGAGLWILKKPAELPTKRKTGVIAA